jgi:hypothetical protein
MKTTIEMHGYEIVISETEEGLLTVQAMKDGEVVEEFELEGGEDHPGMEGTEGDEDEMMPFGGEEESDLGEEEEEMGEEEEEMGEEEEEMGEEEEEMGEEEEEGKLESFNSFVKRKNRR